MSEDRLTKDERMTLEWLAKEDSSAYGECKGVALDTLVRLGLASLGPAEFGREYYRRVEVTDAGREELKWRQS